MRRAYGPRGRHTRPRWTLARDVAASYRARLAAGRDPHLDDYGLTARQQQAVSIWLQLPDQPRLARALIEGEDHRQPLPPEGGSL